MNDTTAVPESLAHLITYEFTPDGLRQVAEQYKGLTFETKEKYEEGRKGISVLVKARTAIEKRRKELKADALEHGRRVDAAAHQLTAIIEEVEKPLKALKAVVDDEHERKVREAEEAALEEARRKAFIEQEAEEKRIQAEKDAEEARLKAIRDAEDERLRIEREAFEAEKAKVEAEQQVERDRLAEEKAKVDAELEAKRKEDDAARAVEQKRIDEENAKLQADRDALEVEKKRLADEEAARVAKVEADAQAERDRIEAEERAERERKEEEERVAAAAARAEALKPEIDRVITYIEALQDVAVPENLSPEVQEVVDVCQAGHGSARLLLGGLTMGEG